MTYIKVKVTLVVYGNNADVPDLTLKDAPVIEKWFSRAMEHLPVKDFNIKHLYDCYYELNWASDHTIDLMSVCDPDPYGETPVKIDGDLYLVEVFKIDF